MKQRKGLIALVFAMLYFAAGFGQSIKGTVKDSVGKPIAYAGVNLKNKASLIIAYTTTNNKGAYTLAIPSDADNTGL